MTKKQLRQKYNKHVRDINVRLRNYLESAIKSGAFDYLLAENDYGLPANIIHAALLDLADEYSAFYAKDKKMIEAIRALTYNY